NRHDMVFMLVERAPCGEGRFQLVARQSDDAQTRDRHEDQVWHRRAPRQGAGSRGSPMTSEPAMGTKISSGIGELLCRAMRGAFGMDSAAVAPPVTVYVRAALIRTLGRAIPALPCASNRVRGHDSEMVVETGGARAAQPTPSDGVV